MCDIILISYPTPHNSSLVKFFKLNIIILGQTHSLDVLTKTTHFSSCFPVWWKTSLGKQFNYFKYNTYELNFSHNCGPIQISKHLYIIKYKNKCRMEHFQVLWGSFRIIKQNLNFTLPELLLLWFTMLKGAPKTALHYWTSYKLIYMSFMKLTLQITSNYVQTDYGVTI